jgi:ABC-type microcin C transport system permease subunit YejB
MGEFDIHGSVLAVAMLVLGIASISLVSRAISDGIAVSSVFSPIALIGAAVGAYVLFILLIVRRRR